MILSRPSRNLVFTTLLTAASYNILRDDLHENTRCLKWEYRAPRIELLIRDMYPAVLALQECRDLENQPFALFQTRLKEIGYKTLLHHNIEDPKLRVATCFQDDGLLHLLQSETYWLPSYGGKFPRPVGCDVFTTPNHRLFVVWNVHFGHNEVEKHLSIEYMRCLISLKAKQLLWTFNLFSMDQVSTLFMGDCNFFGRSGNQNGRERLCSLGQLTDYTINAKFRLAPSGPTGTYVGTSKSLVKPPLGQIGDHLDIIAGHNVELEEAFIWNKTMLEPEPEFLQSYEMFPSDHLPLYIKFKL